MTSFEVTKGWFMVRETPVVVVRILSGVIRKGDELPIGGKVWRVREICRDRMHGDEWQLAVEEVT